jgi:hypothetical protein
MRPDNVVPNTPLFGAADSAIMPAGSWAENKKARCGGYSYWLLCETVRTA